jgi:NADH-quinone oxidoreductase subunit A
VLFVAVGGLFLLAALGLGRLLRPQVPGPAKLEPYECGEPPVGSTLVRFDLRFYVVALVFIIFEVEVALFFPPATVFGKATRLMDPKTPQEAKREVRKELGMAPSGEGVPRPRSAWCPGTSSAEPAAGTASAKQWHTNSAIDARSLALAAMADLGVFFAVILLGFAYVWRRGDLEWVRAIGAAGPHAADRGRRVLGQ